MMRALIENCCSYPIAGCYQQRYQHKKIAKHAVSFWLFQNVLNKNHPHWCGNFLPFFPALIRGARLLLLGLPFFTPDIFTCIIQAFSWIDCPDTLCYQFFLLLTKEKACIVKQNRRKFTVLSHFHAIKNLYDIK